MLAERGSGVVMARARVAKEMMEKRAILERESMTESWSRRASRDENEESLGSESLGGPHPSNGGVVTYHLRSAGRGDQHGALPHYCSSANVAHPFSISVSLAVV